MQHHLILPLLCCFAGFLHNAHAVPDIDKSQGVAGPRSDPGTGVCSSITHFATAQPLTSKADAVAILKKSTTDPAIWGHTARLFDNINFRNGQSNANGDFALPSDKDEVFPYSRDPISSLQAKTDRRGCGICPPRNEALKCWPSHPLLCLL